MWSTHAMPTTLEAAIRMIDPLQAEHAALKQQLAALMEQLAQTQQAQAKSRPTVKATVPKREPKRRHKRAPQPNRGRKRQEPTRVESHALDAGPDCGRTFGGGRVARTRPVIDLPPPAPVAVADHQVIERDGSHCAAWQRPTLDLTGQVLGQGRIGVRIAGLIAWVSLVLRLPLLRLRYVHQLTISVGAIAELRHPVRRALQPQMDALTAQACASPIRHGDETG